LTNIASPAPITLSDMDMAWLDALDRTNRTERAFERP
jgi:hypothetical protein